MSKFSCASACSIPILFNAAYCISILLIRIEPPPTSKPLITKSCALDNIVSSSNSNFQLSQF